ncbi:MAG: sigma-70 family RNA polymerase sigma factor [Pseudomonadota bacterium]
MLDDPRTEIVEHMSAMRSFAISLTRDPVLAEDILQEAVIKAWINFHKFEAGTNLRAWLITILRNTFFSEMRKVKHHAEDAAPNPASVPAVPPRHDGVLQMRDFRRAFRRLSLEHREALLLVGAMGFSYEEAAGMCGVPVGTIKSRVIRARRCLAAHLEIEKGETRDLTDASIRAVISNGHAPAPDL